MAKKNGRMALYEVAGKARLKSPYSRGLEHLRSSGSPDYKPADSVESKADDESSQASTWSAKPKLIRVNSGRVELSVPFELAIALVLGLIVVLCGTFRAGQLMVSQSVAETPVKVTTENDDLQAVSPSRPVVVEPVSAVAVEVADIEDTGNNNIVIQTFGRRADLEPVKSYYSKHGIATEILSYKGTYYLVTARKYSNPAKAGTAGNKALKRIVELGADYKAPQGYESFGKKPFNDAYGMNFGK